MSGRSVKDGSEGDALTAPSDASVWVIEARATGFGIGAASNPVDEVLDFVYGGRGVFVGLRGEDCVVLRVTAGDGFKQDGVWTLHHGRLEYSGTRVSVIGRDFVFYRSIGARPLGEPSWGQQHPGWQHRPGTGGIVRGDPRMPPINEFSSKYLEPTRRRHKGQ